MEWPLVKSLLWALLLFVQIHEHRGCIEEERMGLIELKAFLKSNHLLLPSWVNETKSECCDWEGVMCNTTTNHVIELSLYYLKQEIDEYKTWFLNACLFQPFKELRSLNLSFNQIGGWRGNEESICLSKLSKLTHLDLSHNYFEKEILRSLGALPVLKYLDLSHNAMEGPLSSKELVNLSNLKVLDLGDNRLNGSLPFKDMANFSNLEILDLSGNAFNGLNGRLPTQGTLPVLKYLDLSYNAMEGPLSSKELVNLSNLEVLNLRWNDLNGSLPFKDMANFSSLEILDLSENQFTSLGVDMANFSSLEILDLSNNYLTGSISPFIGALSSLKALSLYDNGLDGTLPTQDLCMLKKLEELDLADNAFEGILPPCLNNLSSLRLLDISNNQFSGNLSSFPIASLISLEYIDLSYNLFEGLFSFSLFANHSKLKVIQFLSNHNKVEIETETPSWNPLFQLKFLVLSNCILNKPTGNIPKFLFHQHELEVVFISHSELNGSFPIWLLENNTRLQLLNLRNNYFAGQFHLPTNHHMYLHWLDVSDNNLDGQLQENIGKMIPNLEFLNLARNHFEGNLPSSICDMTSLSELDLSFNNFSGEVPMELVVNCTSLKVLSSSNNNFHGEIFSHFNLSLSELDLNNNHFTGTLPVVPLEVRDFLDISNNHMLGTIPGWIVNYNTRIVDLSNNFFEGWIPCVNGSYDIINFSHNLLSGLLPTCLNLQDVEHVFLQGNKLTGSLPKAVLNSSSLVTLDIRDNSFFGSIPEEIDGLSDLKVLLLSGNQFSGMIPKQLCRLKRIGIMDLSNNSFFGTIPYCFHNLTFGKLNYTDFANTNEFSFLYGISSFPYKSLIKRYVDIHDEVWKYDVQVKIEFVTKYRFDFYKGLILDMMSLLDLSFNNLSGEIPPELGQLSSILGLNLSYNQLTGSIPKSFSNLTQLESLDLSHNHLSGEIPSVLIDLYRLEVFNVSYNNLSGKLPDMKAQFGTFGKGSYEGNPFLCGPALEKSCTRIDESPPSPQKSSNASNKKWHEVDLLVFSTSFSVSYIIFFMGVVSVLYINPHWRQQCFNLIEDRMYWCYYLAFNALKRLANRMCH